MQKSSCNNIFSHLSQFISIQIHSNIKNLFIGRSPLSRVGLYFMDCSVHFVPSPNHIKRSLAPMNRATRLPQVSALRVTIPNAIIIKHKQILPICPPPKKNLIVLYNSSTLFKTHMFFFEPIKIIRN